MKTRILRRAIVAGVLATSGVIGITAATPAYAQFGGIVKKARDKAIESQVEKRVGASTTASAGAAPTFDETTIELTSERVAQMIRGLSAGRAVLEGRAALNARRDEAYRRRAELADANQKAIEADLAFVERAGRGGFYTLYRAHNYHFLAYAAMFEGRREISLKAVRDLQQEMPVELVLAFPDFLDAFVAVPIHVMVRFGMWQEVLDMPVPAEDELLAARAFWRYGRTVAYSSLGKVDEAEKEFALFREAMAAVPE